jgi:GNAT superfamily N-acetyltransferase
MQAISSSAATPALRALFDPGDPAGLRCFAVLDGIVNGHIFTDDPAAPSWGMVQEIAFGTLHLGGTPPETVVHSLVADLRRQGEVLYGFWPGDMRADLFPATEYDGWVLEFTNRPMLQGLDAYLTIPEGCELRPVDRELIERTGDRDMHITLYGSLEKALEGGLGFCFLKDGEIVCEAFAGAPSLGMMEVGIGTAEAHRQQGYAIALCAHLIHACEQRGYATYWNCAKSNTPSARLARKLGYQREREYRLFAWSQR